MAAEKKASVRDVESGAGGGGGGGGGDSSIPVARPATMPRGLAAGPAASAPPAPADGAAATHTRQAGCIPFFCPKPVMILQSAFFK